MTIQAKLLCAVAVSGFAALAVTSPAQALTTQECSAKYQAAKAAGTLGGQKWNDFRKAQCGVDATAAPAAAPAAAPGAPATSAAPKAAEAKAKKEATPADSAAVGNCYRPRAYRSSSFSADFAISCTPLRSPRSGNRAAAIMTAPSQSAKALDFAMLKR